MEEQGELRGGFQVEMGSELSLEEYNTCNCLGSMAHSEQCLRQWNLVGRSVAMREGGKGGKWGEMIYN